jgi:hypothetical protein
MPITIEERFNSRTGDTDGSIEYQYILEGSDDAEELRDALRDHVLVDPGDTVEGLPFKSVGLVEQLKDELWVGRAVWALKQAQKGNIPATNASIFAFDTTGGSALIRTSLQVISSTAASGTPPTNSGAINQGDGIEIVRPKYEFSVTKFQPNSVVTSTYKDTVYALTGQVNNGTYTIDGQSFAAGTLLFMGAAGSKREDEDDWEIRYSFAASPNRTSVPVGPITVPSVGGWQVLDVLFRQDESQSSLVRTPIAAYVHRVYESGSFSGLAL